MSFFENIDKLKARNLNPIVLAYVGDAVHSLIVRESLAKSRDCKANEMHRLASEEVNARSQAVLADKIFPLLSTEEADVFKRGRNGKSHHAAKNQTLVDYKKATAIEAVFGYLYLVGQSDRILELLKIGENI